VEAWIPALLRGPFHGNAHLFSGHCPYGVVFVVHPLLIFFNDPAVAGQKYGDGKELGSLWTRSL